MYSLRNRPEKLAEGSLFCLFLKLVQINFIFTDTVRILYIYIYISVYYLYSSFNDIVAVAKDKFYGTQYMEYTNTWLLAEIEHYAMLDLGKLWFYDGQELKLIASGFGFPNGINASPDLK